MRSFLPWALLLVIVRGVVVLSLGDAFFYGEELEKAAAGKAMLDGLGVPHHQLAYHYYEGGGFVISHLKALAFYVMGESLLANKVVAMASCLAVLGAGWWACDRLFGRASAHSFGALYVFAPATVQKLSLISLGIHHEACAFILLGLGLSACLMNQQRTKTWLLLGVCLGFGTYFSWVVGLAALTCGLALLVRWRAELNPIGMVAGLAGFLIGGAPLLLMYLEVGSGVFDIHGTGLGDSGAGSASESLREFFRSIYLEGALGGIMGAVAYPVIIVWALIFGRRSFGAAGKSWSRAFAVHASFLFVFAVAYLMSAFVQGAVYHFFLMLRLVPLWAVGAVLVAAVMGRSLDSDESGSAIPLAGLLLIGLGFFGTVQVVAAGNPASMKENLNHLRAERGYTYSSYFQKLIPHLEGDVNTRLQVLLRFDEDDSGLLREAIASELFRRHGVSLEDDFLRARASIEEVEPGKFPEYQRGLGPLLVDWHGDDLPGCLASIQLAGEDAPRLSEALGRTGSGIHPRGPVKTLDEVERVLLADAALVQGNPGDQAFARGVGWRLHRVLHRTVFKPWRAEAFIERVPGSMRGALREGYEAATRQGRLGGAH